MNELSNKFQQFTFVYFLDVVLVLVLLPSSRTSVRVKLGLFNAKIRNENRRYIHRLIYQLNEQDLLCHSI